MYFKTLNSRASVGEIDTSALCFKSALSAYEPTVFIFGLIVRFQFFREKLEDDYLHFMHPYLLVYSNLIMFVCEKARSGLAQCYRS